MLHLVGDRCETQGYIMTARIRTLDPKTCKNEDLDDEIKFNMLGKSEILGSDMETKAHHWA